MHVILWDFEIQTYHSIPTRIPNLELIRKNIIGHFVDFAFPERKETKAKS